MNNKNIYCLCLAVVLVMALLAISGFENKAYLHQGQQTESYKGE